MKKLLLAFLSLAIVFGAVACNKTNDDDKDKDKEKEVTEIPTIDDEAYYDSVLGDFVTAYAKAKTATSVSERFAYMAVAEAKLMESGTMIPFTANGGNYAISNVAPYSICNALWGNDEYRYYNAIVCTTTISNTDRTALKALWAEKRGTGTYDAAAIAYLTEKGYTLKDTYTIAYSSENETYDAFATSNAADGEVLVNTMDGLLEYNDEGDLKGKLATSWSCSEDGLTWTFQIRKGCNWTDSEGKVIGEVTADDFVAGFQHMLDDREGGLSWLVDGIVKGVTEYINGETADFSTVGVKAVDTYTLQYTLEAPCSYFETMFGYSVFSPLNRSFYLSQGGVFGYGKYAEAENYKYGTSPDTIAYCGPYLIKTHVDKNTYVFEANKNYWNYDNTRIKTITWIFNDGKNPTQAYENYKAGTIDSTDLTSANLELCKNDGKFEDYAYVTSTGSSSYPAFLNVYRRAVANYNDATKATTTLSLAEIVKTNTALANQDLRLALAYAWDRGAYEAAIVGEDLKLTSLVNSYTPGTFVKLDEAVTIKINGTDTTFAAGTYYGKIMQAQITADGYEMKVFDETADGGMGSSCGYDGWYNVDAAKSRLNKAITALAAQGITVDAEHPIKIEFTYWQDGSSYEAAANALKKSVEAALDGKVQIVLNGCTSYTDWSYAAYYFNAGAEANYTLSALSGWGPDYGDPSTYLDSMVKGGGYLVKCIGLEA